MNCPECNGTGAIALSVRGIASTMPCPTCEGTGELPDRTLYPNNCPACGEPIAADRKWCEFHAVAEELENGS